MRKLLLAFAARLLGTLILVFSTFNPTGYSLVHWVMATGARFWLAKLGLGVGLFMLYYFLIHVSLDAFRLAGLVAAILVSILFTFELAVVLIPHVVYQSWDGYALVGEYILLVSFALVIAFGVTWSGFIEHLTGQQQKRYL